MDLLSVLEGMASNVGEEADDEIKLSEESIRRWLMLFGHSPAEAVEQIQHQKGDYTRYQMIIGT